MTWPLRIAGLDPSLTSFGLGITEGPGNVTLLRFRPKTRGHERLNDILEKITDYAAQCDIAVVEGAVLIAAGGGENRLAISGLHWMVRHKLWELGVPYAVVAPSTRSKYITGNGGASKEDCLVAAIKRFPDANVDGNDVADALTLAQMGADAYGQPLVSMPQDRTALLHAARTTKGHKGEPVIDWPKIKLEEATDVSTASPAF